MAKKQSRRSQSPDAFMAKALDDLQAFDEFNEHVLPKLRDALKGGKSAEDIYAMATAAAAARNVTIALTDPDPGKAMSAIKDILDRHGGKATDRKEVVHKLDRLPDEQLDAALKTKLAQLAEDSEDDEEEDETPATFQ